MGDAPRILSFGDIELDEALKEVRCGGAHVPLALRSFELLHYLIEHRDRVVPKEELFREIWGGIVVSDAALSTALRDLRRAIGDTGAEQRWLQTLRGRGYRFLGAVRVQAAVPEGGDLAPGESPSPPPERALRLGTVPPLPRAVLGRDRDIEAIRSALSVPGPALCAVHGWPGVGKTTLAAVLARDEPLASRFRDGVLWSSLGPACEPARILQRWARALGVGSLAEETALPAEELGQRLGHLIRDRHVLVILDDLWRLEDFIALRIGGAQSGLLVTTRLTRLADEIANGTERYRLGLLSQTDALDLLELLVPAAVRPHRASCERLVQTLEGLPLALHVAAGLLKAEIRYGRSPEGVLKSLIEDDRLVYESHVPTDLARDSSPTVAALVRRSTDGLDPVDRTRFAALGMFAEKPAIFDEAAVEAAWGIDDPGATLRELVDRGLLESAGRSGHYQMHALLKTHAEALMNELEADADDSRAAR